MKYQRNMGERKSKQHHKDMDLYREKHRIASNRKSGKDYASPSPYFITVCTEDRKTQFGEICHGMMGLNHAGCAVADEIQRTPIVRPCVSIDSWVVMPNHVHVIVVIHPNNPVNAERWFGIVGDTVGAPVDDTVGAPVETHRRCVSTQVNIYIPLFRRRPYTLGSIVAQIKSLSTKRIHTMGYTDFAWQPNYHDHIIRTHDEWQRIRQYIIDNPMNWDRDRNNPTMEYRCRDSIAPRETPRNLF